MSRYAPIVPIDLQIEFRQANLMGPYHLLLAQEILKEEEKYHLEYSAHAPEFTIVDNGVAEGQLLSGAEIIHAARTVYANALVLPDVQGNANETYLASRNFLRTHADALRTTDFLYMAVVQGSSIQEIEAVAGSLLTLDPEVRFLAVPRNLVKRLGSRIDVVRHLFRVYGRPIHLLGFSEDLADDIESAQQIGVMGIDSAMPIWWGMTHHVLPINPPGVKDYGKRPDWYWSRDQPDIVSTAIMNILRVREWLKR